MAMQYPIEEFKTAVTTYKTGRFSTGKRWYGKIRPDGLMDFITIKEYEAARKTREGKVIKFDNPPF